MDYQPMMLSDLNVAVEKVDQLTEVIKTWSIPAMKQMVRRLVDFTAVTGEKPYADLRDLCHAIDYSYPRFVNVAQGVDKPSKVLITKLYRLYSQHFSDAEIACAECGGQGQISSDAQLPWGQSVMIPCPACASKISVAVIPG